MFEDDVCVDPSSVLDERPNYANVIFSGFFAGPYTGRPEVIDQGPYFTVGLPPMFYDGARFPPVLAPFGGAAAKV